MNDFDTTKPLRASVATYNQVIFPNPENGMNDAGIGTQSNGAEGWQRQHSVTALWRRDPILNPTPLQAIIGKIQFDSERSKQEQDFRILIPPSKWELIKDYCLHHLEFEEEEDIELEFEPDRELTEEFMEAINVKLNPGQYTVQPLGFVIENNPVQSKNDYARGD